MFDRFRRTTVSALALAGLLILTTVLPSFAATIVVAPGNLDGWAVQTSGAATVTFVNGPSTPPLPTGSARLAVGANGGDAAQLRNGNYAGTLLSEISELRYSTFVQQDGAGGQAPYIMLGVDHDGNGSADDLLFFEPVYQTAAFCPTNPQPALALNTWQPWDALNGCWWSTAGTAGAGPGTNTKPLSVIIAADPDARIAPGTGTAGAVRLVAGFGAGAWNNFIGNVDAFKIKTSTRDDLYNFEAQLPPPTDKDQCKGDGWKAYKKADGSPMFKNQGDCVSFVATGGRNAPSGR